MVALVGSFVYGCSSTSSSNGGTDTDAGVTPSDGGKKDTGTTGGNDGGQTGDAANSCAPADVSGFTPPTYHSANTPSNVCTTTQISAFYDGCLGPAQSQQACAPFGSTGSASNQACAKCLVSAETNAKYGPLISHKGTVSVNIAGCMEIKDATNGLTCAKAYQASEACDAAACTANCPVTDDPSFQLYEACVQQAAANGCKTYTTAAACADAEAEAGAASVCFAGATFQDLFLGVSPIFCSAGGGGG